MSLNGSDLVVCYKVLSSIASAGGGTVRIFRSTKEKRGHRCRHGQDSSAVDRQEFGSSLGCTEILIACSGKQSSLSSPEK